MILINELSVVKRTQSDSPSLTMHKKKMPRRERELIILHLNLCGVETRFLAIIKNDSMVHRLLLLIAQKAEVCRLSPELETKTRFSFLLTLR